MTHIYGDDGMLTHMRTTVEVSDAVLAEAKRLAERDGQTLRELFEAALRHEIARRRDVRPFRLRDASFRGDGLQPEFQGASWDRFLDAIYEGRGA